MYFDGGLVTRLGVRLARFEDNLVELQEQRIGILEDCGRQVGELQTVLSHAGFIKDFAQAENVGGRSSRSFGRDVTLGSEIRRCSWLAVDVCDEANVCEFRRAVYEDDVGRLYVTMDETMLMQEVQRGGQVECQVHAFADRQLAALAEHVREGFSRVGFWNDFLALTLVVPEFHDVIEVASDFIASHVQYIDESWMRAGDRGEPLDTSELAIKRRGVHECSPVNELHCVKSSNDAACQPYLTVGPFADAPHQSMIRNTWRCPLAIGSLRRCCRTCRGNLWRLPVAGCFRGQPDRSVAWFGLRQQSVNDFSLAVELVDGNFLFAHEPLRVSEY